MNKQRRTSNINNVVQYDTSGNVTIPQIDNAGVDTDKFIVSDNGTITFRTGAEVLSDIGGQGAITLTTTGSTGPATLIGTTLNIPQYSAVAVVPQSRTLTINSTTYDLSADRTWSVGTVTSVGITLGTSGTDIAVSNSPVTGSGAITIDIPTASATNRGALSAADWITFNDKQPAGSYISALTGEATATGPGSVAITLTNSAVVAKVLTGLAISGSSITSADSILSAMGKLQNQINGLTGSLIYKGSWNAATNTPTINSGVGVAGNFYIVTTAGSTTIDGTSSWAVGDWIIFSGSVWQKVPNTNAVVSVNTYTGVVVLYTDDIQEDPNPTNLWFTPARAQAAITGGASTIVTADLTASRALVSNSSGKVAVSAVTSTELGYVSGVSSAIQTQLNGKEPTITAGTISDYWRGDKTWQTLPTYTFNSLSPMTTLGDTIYGAASGAGTRLAGNTTTTKKFLVQTGTGTVSAAPLWDVLSGSDIPNNTAQAGSVAQLLTFKSDGTGDAATVTYNGGTARTISYNTVGAQASSAKLTSLSGLTYVASSIVRMTGANTFSLDTTSYQVQLNGTGFIKASGTTISYDNSTYQVQLNGTGFVKVSGTTVSYDNSTYLTTSSASSTYLTISNAAATYQPIGSYVTGAATLGYYPITSGSTTNIATSSLQEVSGITRNTGSGFITGVGNGYWFGTSTTGVNGMTGYSTANTLVFYTNSTERLYIHSSGRVFVNSTTDAGSSYQLQVNGAVYASAYYESSDIRKKNVIEYNPTVMMDVDVIKFTRIGSDDIRYGYSAQQVMEISPDLVSADAELGVKYIDVHTLKIAALEREIKELKAKLAN